MMTGNQIRRTFLDFFAQNGHRIVRSSSLLPVNDPTLLFSNAGMNQFKDIFLGLESRDYRRAVSCQKCVRAGGKHNDLENVGYTNRHHTFFEMLGNFSFGDYFKKEAIAFAWDLVTSSRGFGISPEKLYVTIFKGEGGIERDSEAWQYWVSQGVGQPRIFEFGAKENFWSMGDTGPCGPCSEIHYDMGPQASEQGHPDCAFGCECGRYVEIWNLVFMQFNRDAAGQLVLLPRPSVDTGAGLERLAAVLQGKVSNFDTDLFAPLIARASELTGVQYASDAPSGASLRILADHARATTFLISDGVIPSNEGRGYVLRKIMRRAIDHGRRLGREGPFLYQMAGTVADQMKTQYPEVREALPRIVPVIKEEEEKYARLVVPAVERFNSRLQSRQRHAAKSGEAPAPTIDGKDLFFAYDTLGLRTDFVRDLAQEHGWTVSSDADAQFEQELAEQRRRAKASWKGTGRQGANPVYARLAETFRTEPDFYFGTATRDCKIEAIVTPEGRADQLRAGAEAEVVLDRTALYAESGGQVADAGWFYDNSESLQVAEVLGAYYPVAGLIAHRVRAIEDLHLGDRLATVADSQRRTRNRRNHTATHLLHAALRNVLGTHVKQAGSLVAPDHLRFDFTHFAPVAPGELAEIEQQVNEETLRNLEIQTDIMNLDEALASGAMAFFGDKYPEQNVRVVSIPDAAYPRGFYSRELCGGTHVGRTGEIGVLKLVGEQSTAAGVRRIEAISGDAALERFRASMETLRQAAALLNAGDEDLLAKISQLAQRSAELQKEQDALKRAAAGSLAEDLIGRVRKIKDVTYLAAAVSGVDRPGMRQLVDLLRQKMGSGVVILATAEDGKVALITGVTKDLTQRLHAGKIIQELARQVGGSGGGRPDLAEAGGKDTSAIENAIAQVPSLLARML